MSDAILIAGGTGFLGQELGIALTRKGYSVTVLTRNPSEHKGLMSFPCKFIGWGKSYHMDPKDLEPYKAIINLCGLSIAETPWTKDGKQKILSSRTDPTRALVNALKSCQTPKVFLQASGAGYYGDRGAETLGDDATLGDGFLAETCKAWEEPLQGLKSSSVRTCALRIGPVFGLAGGMLRTLDQIYNSGGGARLGDGKQYVPWIHIDDLCELFCAAVSDERYSGSFNAVAPTPVTYSELHANLRAFKPWFALPAAPRFVLRALFRDKAALLLSSQRAVPEKAIRLGFKFRFPTLNEALRDLYHDQKKPGVFWLLQKQWVARTPDSLWPFFSDAQNLERLTPPFLNFRVLKQNTPKMEEGTCIDYQLKLHGIPLTWRSRIEQWQPPRKFVDRQLKGPYGFWHHEHSFEALGHGTLMTDRVQYLLPIGFLGGALAHWYVSRDLQRIFSYRRKTVAELFES